MDQKSTRDKRNRLNGTVVLMVGCSAIMITMVLGIVTLVAVLGISQVLNNQKKQDTVSACRSNISQTIQEDFRVQLSALVDALHDDKNLLADEIRAAIRNEKKFSVRFQSECIDHQPAPPPWRSPEKGTP